MRHLSCLPAETHNDMPLLTHFALQQLMCALPNLPLLSRERSGSSA